MSGSEQTAVYADAPQMSLGAVPDNLTEGKGNFTYFPEARSIYAGSYTDLGQIYRHDQFLASVMPDYGTHGIGRKAGLTLEHDAQPPTDGPIPRIFDRLSERFASNYAAVARVAALRRLYKRHQITPGQLQALHQLERTADVNDGNIFQITIVQFIDRILGEIENDVVVTRAAFSIPLNGLRGKIPEGGWFGLDMQVDRLNEPNIWQNEFGQTEVRIKRNDIHMYMSKEDRMEASIDPWVWNITQAQANRIQSRDLQALVALSSIETGFESGAGIEYNSALKAQVINDPTEQVAGGGVYPRARYDIPGEFLAISKRHFNRYRNRPRTYVMGLNTFRAIETNWYALKGKNPPDAGTSGIVDFPGLAGTGIKAYVSWWCPEGIAYGLGSRGFYEFDGPMNVDSSYDQRRHADFLSIRDYVGYFVINPHRYCEKVAIPISGVNTVAAGGSAGGVDELTSFAEVEQMLSQPENLPSNKRIVNQNDNA